MRRFRDEVIEGNPGLRVPLGMVLATQGRLTAARRWLAPETDLGVPPGEPLWIARERATAWLLRSDGDVDAARARVESALDRLPAGHDEHRLWLDSLALVLRFEDGDPEADFAALAAVVSRALDAGQPATATLPAAAAVRYLLDRRQLQAARAFVADVLARLLERGDAFTIVPALGAEIAYEANDLAEAERLALMAAEADISTAYTESFVPPLVTLARVRLARGERDGAADALRRFERRIAHLETAAARAHFPALVAGLHGRLGDLDTAQRWLDAREWDAGAASPHLHTEAYLTATRLLLATGKAAEASRMAGHLRSTAEEAELGGLALRAAVVEASARMQHGDRIGALRTLRPLLRDAIAGGYVRTFLDGGEGVMAVLRGLAADPDAGAAAARLLEHDRDHAVTPALGPAQLSEREFEVLRSLAAGLSNREIADALVVSLDTVKTHVRNVYGKLGVHTRMQAAAVAREKGLI